MRVCEIKLFTYARDKDGPPRPTPSDQGLRVFTAHVGSRTAAPGFDGTSESRAVHAHIIIVGKIPVIR